MGLTNSSTGLNLLSNDFDNFKKIDVIKGEYIILLDLNNNEILEKETEE